MLLGALSFSLILSQFDYWPLKNKNTLVYLTMYFGKIDCFVIPYIYCICDYRMSFINKKSLQV